MPALPEGSIYQRNVDARTPLKTLLKQRVLIRISFAALVGVAMIRIGFFWQLLASEESALKQRHHSIAKVTISFAEQLGDLIAPE